MKTSQPSPKPLPISLPQASSPWPIVQSNSAGRFHRKSCRSAVNPVLLSCCPDGPGHLRPVTLFREPQFPMVVFPPGSVRSRQGTETRCLYLMRPSGRLRHLGSGAHPATMKWTTARWFQEALGPAQLGLRGPGTWDMPLLEVICGLHTRPCRFRASASLPAHCISALPATRGHRTPRAAPGAGLAQELELQEVAAPEGGPAASTFTMRCSGTSWKKGVGGFCHSTPCVRRPGAAALRLVNMLI